jgi:lysophospholipase L1-like esterase
MPYANINIWIREMKGAAIMKKNTLLVLTFTSILIWGFFWGMGVFCQGSTSYTCAYAQDAAAALRREPPKATAHFTKTSPASDKPFLTWTKVDGAVAYEIELLKDQQANPGAGTTAKSRFYTTKQIYTNGYNAVLPTDFDNTVFYWRVRALDLDGNAMSKFSDIEAVPIDPSLDDTQKPIITAHFNEGHGSTLLYPVYAWIPVNGAAAYEVEILDAIPENPNGISPSIHRIDTLSATGFDVYDHTPRMADTPYYWRVRGLDQDGNPVGVYSDAGTFSVNPSVSANVATYGDSITHGGGSISYSPADWEYSYQHYLDFQSINLGRSGDTSQSMVERFDSDVLPFHPQFLIILAGTNSLRGGIPASSVIADLMTLKEKCETNDIHPVFLTLPTINPANIRKAFDEPTDPSWKINRQLVNAYIRTQTHIDIADKIDEQGSILPTNLALDGIHLDIAGKQLMASVINAEWRHITQIGNAAPVLA